MFNFQNLNPSEFEDLSKDILGRILGIKVRTYATGRDGGVDIGPIDNANILGQVKHYLRTSTNTVVNNLKRELKHVVDKKPSKYYIFVSRELTYQNIEDIFSHFSEYMSSKENIYDEKILNDFLSHPDNKDILRKHYKLWITSTNILESVISGDVFIDSDFIMEDIKKKIKYLVPTNSYYEALELLNNERIVILQGHPGVGKTTISEMLLLYYANEGYQIRYVSDNSVSSLKKSLSQDNEIKEIILIDDFLGQHYISMNENTPNQIKSLIGHIRLHKNKILILNTRVTILKEAERTNFRFRDYLEDTETKKYSVNVDDMSITEKGTILYNRLHFLNVPDEYLMDIITDKRYKKIIQHPNYNPRIIEYVTKKRFWKDIDPNDYFNRICDALNNPKDIWNDEFSEKIEDIDRALLLTLYSLSDKPISESLLKECFDNRMLLEKKFQTNNPYESSLMRLTESMLKITTKNNKKHVTVINPSVNDFISHKLKNSPVMVQGILDSACYFEQLNNMMRIKNQLVLKHIKKLTLDEAFMELKVQFGQIEVYFLKYVEELNIKVKKLQPTVLNAINSYASTEDYTTYWLYPWHDNHIISLIKNEEIMKFYQLYEIILSEDFIRTQLKLLDFNEIVDFLYFYKNKFSNPDMNEEKIDKLTKIIEDTLEMTIPDLISSKVISDISDELSESISDTCFQLRNKYDESDLTSIIEDEFRDEIRHGINKYTNKIYSANFDFYLDVEVDTVLEERNIYQDVCDNIHASSGSSIPDIKKRIKKVVDNFVEVDKLFSHKL